MTGSPRVREQMRRFQNATGTVAFSDNWERVPRHYQPNEGLTGRLPWHDARSFSHPYKSLKRRDRGRALEAASRGEGGRSRLFGGVHGPHNRTRRATAIATIPGRIDALHLCVAYTLFTRQPKCARACSAIACGTGECRWSATGASGCASYFLVFGATQDV